METCLAGIPEAEMLQPTLTVQPLGSHFTTLYLSLLICKMG